MWNLKNKINKQNRNRLTDTENRLTVAGGEVDWEQDETGEEITKYRSVVTK